MLLQKSTTVMARQRLQQRHPAGVLHAALLLLCLALLMHASASSVNARPLPSDIDTGDDPEVVRQPEEGGVRPQEFFPVEKAEPQFEAKGQNWEDCEFLPDSEIEPCEDGLDRRMLSDYGDGSPDQNQDNRPAGPLP